jgi:transcriptional regulator with XRE-family HTH domain
MAPQTGWRNQPQKTGTERMMMADEADIAKLVKKARAEMGISQPELARRVSRRNPEHPCSQQTVDKIETGKIKFSSFLPAIATELGIPVDRVLRIGHKNGATAAIPGHQLLGERDLPVYAASFGGNGVQTLSVEAVDYVLRPAPLERVKDGYGVLVVDDSMAPEFEAGDRALVNPHLPARPGNTCVFRKSADAGSEVCIRRLRKVSDKGDWLVSEWRGAPADAD